MTWITDDEPQTDDWLVEVARTTPHSHASLLRAWGDIVASLRHQGVEVRDLPARDHQRLREAFTGAAMWIGRNGFSLAMFGWIDSLSSAALSYEDWIKVLEGMK